MSTGDLPPGARERIKEEGGDGENVKREDVSDQVKWTFTLSADYF